MKFPIALLFVSALLITACDSTPQEDTADKQTSEAKPSASTTHDYRCESGQKIIARYPSTDSATVTYRSKDHTMEIATSGSGARYVGDGLEWWTKGSDAGSDGTLFRHKTDDTTGEIVESCSRS